MLTLKRGFELISWKQKKPGCDWQSLCPMKVFELDYYCWGCCSQMSKCHTFQRGSQLSSQGPQLVAQAFSFLGRTSWLGGEYMVMGSVFNVITHPSSVSLSNRLGEVDFLKFVLWSMMRFPGWEMWGFSWKRWVLSEQFGGGCRRVPWPYITPALLWQWTLLLNYLCTRAVVNITCDLWWTLMPLTNIAFAFAKPFVPLLSVTCASAGYYPWVWHLWRPTAK